MRWVVLIFLFLLLGMQRSNTAHADDVADCKSRDPDAAIAACSKILRRSGLNARDRAAALGYRSIAYSFKGMTDEALADGIRAVEADPKSPSGYIVRGRMYLLRGELDLAIGDADRAIRADPRAFHAYQLRANALARRGENDLALHDYDKANALKPDDPFIVADRGTAHARKGDFEKAIADFSRSIQINPKLAGAYVFRGKAYAYLAESERALADLSRAVALEPKNSEAYATRGGVYVFMNETERGIADIQRALELNPNSIIALLGRGAAYTNQGALDRALKDYNRAIELNPKEASAYSSRCLTYLTKDEPERALADCNRAIELNPKLSAGYVGRGRLFASRKDFGRALADFARALELVPKNHVALAQRGRTYVEMGQPDRAISDLERAIQLLPKYQYAFAYRGMAYAKQGQLERGLADLTKAIQLDSRLAEAFGARAEVYLATSEWGQAIADLRKVLSLPARNELERTAQLRAAEFLTSLAQKAPPVPATIPAAPHKATVAPVPNVPVVTATSGGSKRIALVIGNSAYAYAGELRNPANDAKAIAGVLRRVGFTDVIDKYDLGLAQMTAALKDFGDRVAGADWAIVYFAGHGIEMGGNAYLLPTDARLEKDAHVPYETVPLDRLLQTVDSAKKLRLIILDACRNNPFVARMVRSGGGSRAIGRGLPALEVEGDVLVAYATKHGTTALDGEGQNSPYALALVENMPAPNVDIRIMFGRVRDTVRRTTNSQQEPYTYGSIGGDLLYFASTAK
jgi:tetratricopeptide (TPR) repeat protein